MVFPLGDVAQTRIIPWVNYGLIAMNVLMYFIQISRPESFTMALAATPYEITHVQDLDGAVPIGGERDQAFPELRPVDLPVIQHAPSPIPILLTLFTSMFLHGSPLHLAGNMLYLWIFGDNVEEVLGHARYLVIYLACGLAGSLAQILAAPDSMIPTLGASGAIAGMMGAYLVWFPHNRVRVLLFRFITEVPALVVIGLWILGQLWAGIGSFGSIGEEGGVAYLAHIGGAAAGIAMAFVFRNRARQHSNLITQVGWSGEHRRIRPGHPY